MEVLRGLGVLGRHRYKYHRASNFFSTLEIQIAMAVLKTLQCILIFVEQKLLPYFLYMCQQMRILFFKAHLHGKKVQVGKDQEKAQSEKDSHSKNRGGKKPN